ncbi:MAG: T9SS type A sorting domain-containing protein [Dysgonamonadaceae bacterium]|jgi:uncharacterized repeat protein (TIGR02543 family)|nr:T9SS type A sorting domain-containing protein [Dysgonamonadaceae bacterium]
MLQRFTKTGAAAKFLFISILIFGSLLIAFPLRAQQLFSLSHNELKAEKVTQIKTQAENVKIPTLSLMRNKENKDVFSMPFSSVEDTKLIILNEQTGNHVVITPVEKSLTEFQLSPFFIEELKQGVLGDASSYLIVESTSNFSVTNITSVSTSQGDVYIPRYFYGKKENVQEALPRDRQIIGVFKQKPQFIPAFPDDPENLRYVAQLEEEMSYYIYMFKLPDGTLCTYDEHFNPDVKENKSSVGDNLVFDLSGTLTAQQRTATEYALGLWSQQLAGTVPVDIQVSFASLGSGVLGSSRIMQEFFDNGTYTDCPNTWYPSSLWNQLVGYDATSLKDIQITMSSNFNFYFGLDGNTLLPQYDYVTIMLHEVTHGLGFAGLCQSDGRYLYSLGNGYGNYTNYPGIFDRQLYQGTTGACLTDLTQSQRAALVISNNLYAGRPGSNLLEANEGTRVRMYAPSTYSGGSSVCHWNNNPGFANFMQYAYQYPLHTFNKRKIGILLDLGWKLPSDTSDNIECDNARSLSCGTTVTGDLTDATPTTSISYSDQSDKNNVFYYFTSAGSGNYTITLDDFSGNKDLFLYSSCSDTDALASSTSDEPTETITYTCTEGTTYRIRITDYSDTGGTFNISLTCPITYMVSYDGNGHTGGKTASSIHLYDVEKALTSNGFTRVYTVTYNHNGSGAANTKAMATYTFNNWSSTSSGESPTYTDGQSVMNLSSTNGEIVNLYAQWNSGSVTLPTPARTGYTFAGWYTAPKDGTKIGDGGDIYTPTANIILYAQWTTNPDLQLLSLEANETLYQDQTGSFTATLKNNGNAAYNSRLWVYLEKLNTDYPNQWIEGGIVSIAVNETKTISISGVITLPPDIYTCNMIQDINNDPFDMDTQQFDRTILDVQVTVETPTGINEVLTNQLSIFPNPAKDGIFIKSDLPIEKVEIYSLTGNLLLQENNFKEKIFVSDLLKGLYLLKIYTDRGVTVSKIVKE